MSHKILGVVTFMYLFIFFLHVLYFAVKKQKVISVIWATFFVTIGLHTAGLAFRWLESYKLGIGHAPMSNFYESLIFYAWSISFVLVVMKKRLIFPAITMLASLVDLTLMGYASLSPSVEKTIQPLMPALQSNWLYIHVFTCFIAYAAFAISFLSSILYLSKWKGFQLPEEKLEGINYRSVAVGFPMLSAGILTGAVWAHYAWGSYWSWDPKETWSLITWIMYALFLHARLTKGLKGKKMAFFSILGFLCVIFTYFGVNFILSGLHSYMV